MSNHFLRLDQIFSGIFYRLRISIKTQVTAETKLTWSIISDIKELEIYGGHLGFDAYPQAIKYLREGLVKPQKVVTHNFPLKDWKKAIDTAENHLENSIKVTMTP